MGRFWLGLGILLAMLAVGICFHWSADSTNTAISQALDSAAEQMLQGNGEAAHRLAQQARAEWEQNWHRTAAFADHAPMDEIDSLFAGLDVYQQVSNADFAAYCARISMLIRAVGEAQTFNWWNLL